jgi:ABC-2 type transport system permease protein
MAIIGNAIGSAVASGGYRAPAGLLAVVVANLFCLYFAVGGVAYFVSACSDRRGRAVGVVFAIVLTSFFLQMLGQFWSPAKTVGFLGVLHYYRPYEVLQNGSVPWGNIVTLVLFGAVFWVSGGVKFQRRDICTT